MKIALSKGRIAKNFYQTLLEKGLIDQIIEEKRNLRIKINNDYEILLVKPNDVINLVDAKFADIGIVGSDTLEEQNNNQIVDIFDLQTGICSFALASLPNTTINDIKVIATKYPNIAKRLLQNINLSCQINQMDGSLEIAPQIGYADAIIDLVETGNTLKANGLVVNKYLEKISNKLSGKLLYLIFTC